MSPPAAILDVDGTLVDTVYLHTVAWQRALRRCGLELPAWRLHRHIGMGGDKYVAAVAGDEFEERHGDEVRDAHADEFEPLIDEARPLPNARELVETLKDRGHTVVLASSAKQDELDHYLDLLDVRGLADGWTSSADVDATKPNPELIEVALEQAGGKPAVMVGDSTFDCEAAARAEIPSVGLLTGGFGADELREAGAAVVLSTLEDLIRRMDETPLAEPD